MTPSRRPPSPVWRKLLWGLVSGLLVLGMLEGVARWLDPRLPSWQGSDSLAVVMTGHPLRLWGLSEGLRDNANTVATIDPIGIRAPVPSVPRPEDVERILVLGDSSFFGYGIDDDETFSAHLDRLLDGTDTVNAAIPGYSTAQAQLLMDDVGWNLEPSLLLIGCFWSDTNFAPYSDADLLQSRAAAGHAWMAKSALVRLLAGRLRMGGIVSWTRFDRLPEATQRRVPLNAYTNGLDRLVREARDRGIGAAIITPPEPLLLAQNAPPRHHWASYLTAQITIAAHHDIPHIQTTTLFQNHLSAAVAQTGSDSTAERTRARDALFFDDIHPTALGQSIMAKAVVQELAERGWPENRLLGQGLQPVALAAPQGDKVQPSDRKDTDSSPMAHLFPHHKTPRSPAVTSDPALLRDGKDVDSEAGQRPETWTVHGQVYDQPCVVKVIDPAGHALAQATITQAGPYRLRVTKQVAQVHVVLKGKGCTGEGTASQADGGGVVLSPPSWQSPAASAVPEAPQSPRPDPAPSPQAP